MQAKDDFLYTYPCPVYYCRCFPETAAEMTVCINIFNDANPDKQCSCDREGTKNLQLSHKLDREQMCMYFIQVSICRNIVWKLQEWYWC